MLKNSVALLTGGASGLGHATITRLVKQGSKVVFCDLLTSSGHETAKEFGDTVTFVPANVVQEHDVQNVIDEIERLHGRLDIVVNCAGLCDSHPIHNFNKGRSRFLEGFKNILATNVLGHLNVNRLAARLIAKNDPDANQWRGVIVNTAGVEGLRGTQGQVSTAAASAAVIAMTEPLAKDLNECGIRVFTVVPGVFKTPLNDFLPREVQNVMAMECMIAPNRFGEADEYAHLVQSGILNPSINATTIELSAGFSIPC